MTYPFARIFSRLLALLILVMSLIIISHGDQDEIFVSVNSRNAPPTPQTPTVTVDIQPGAPIAISSPRVLFADSQHAEFAFDLTNTSNTPVRAYAIRQDVHVEKRASSKFLFSNLPVSGKAPLDPKSMTTSFDTCDITFGEQPKILLSIDYVEFADGSTWGADSGQFLEISAGQRAAVTLLTGRLLDPINSSDGRDAIVLIEDARAAAKPMPTQSEQWKQGFRFAVESVTERLKRVYTQGGTNQLKNELAQLTKQITGNRRAN